MNRSLGSCKQSSSYQLQLIFPIINLMTLKLRQCSTSHCRSAFNLLWYAFEYALDAGVVLPTWKELVNVSASRVSRISESAVNVWVKEIKSICQVKGQPEIIHPVKSQSKYLVSQAFDRGRRSEYMIYWSATPLYFALVGCRFLGWRRMSAV